MSAGEATSAADEVACRRCGHGYTGHEDGGRRCLENGATRPSGCGCDGFRWVDPQPPGGADAGHRRSGG